MKRSLFTISILLCAALVLACRSGSPVINETALGNQNERAPKGRAVKSNLAENRGNLTAVTFSDGQQTFERTLGASERHTYTFEARQGQQLHISIKSTWDDALFTMRCNGRVLDEKLTRTESEIEEPGAYEITVRGDPDRAETKYRLSIGLK